MTVRDQRFENFSGELRDVIEQNFTNLAYGSDEANDMAWQIAERWAWRLWAEISRDLPPAEDAVGKPLDSTSGSAFADESEALAHEWDGRAFYSNAKSNYASELRAVLAGLSPAPAAQP